MKTEIINEVPYLVFEKGDEKELSQFVGVDDTLWKLPNKEVWIKRIGPLTFKSIVEVESGFMVRAIPQPSIDDLKIGDVISAPNDGEYFCPQCTIALTPTFEERCETCGSDCITPEGRVCFEINSETDLSNFTDIRLISRGAGVPLRSE